MAFKLGRNLPGGNVPGQNSLFPGAGEEGGSVGGEGEAGAGGAEAAEEGGFGVVVLISFIDVSYEFHRLPPP